MTSVDRPSSPPAQDIAEFLRGHELFHGLDSSEREVIAQRLEVQRYPAGAIIVSPDEQSAGAVRLVWRGAVDLLDQCRALDRLGERELFGHRRCSRVCRRDSRSAPPKTPSAPGSCATSSSSTRVSTAGGSTSSVEGCCLSSTSPASGPWPPDRGSRAPWSGSGSRKEAGTLPRHTAESLEEAFDLLTSLRLDHQVDALRAGLPADDFIDPRTLNPLARRYLRDAFRAIASIQRTLGNELEFEGPGA